MFGSPSADRKWEPVWGHGAYVAPDWNADWLHREAMWILNKYAKEQFGKAYDALDEERQAMLRARLKKEIRTNTYQEETGDLVLSPIRAEAVEAISRHYAGLFGSDPKLDDLRDQYAIPQNTIKDPERMQALNAFFFWTSWACATNRPGENITYTNNWPHEPLIGNRAHRDHASSGPWSASFCCWPASAPSPGTSPCSDKRRRVARTRFPKRTRCWRLRPRRP